MTQPRTIIICLITGILLLAIPVRLQAQQPPISSNVEQQLEGITENTEDAETQDDSFLQQMRQFLRNPINLNTADAATLKELLILTPLQVQNLISYRSLFGNFINLYEIQAIPNWDLATIEKLRPYITVSNEAKLATAFSERLSDGTHSLLARMTQVLEKSRGYLVDPTTVKNYYPGSPQRYFVRYKYQYKNLLQYGVVGEKDAGEEFFKGSQRQGFDFYSAHLFARNIGIIKSLALGDYTVNLGQGLIQWQNLAFKKSADVTNVKRQLAKLRPYNSAGEINFHRGAGITIGKNNWEATGFVSYRNLDANLVVDTLNNEDFISSFQSSGLHRTQSELEDKNAQRQIAYGGNFTYDINRLHLGVNTIQYHFKLPVQRNPEPYNIYAISGTRWGNTSIDYSYTVKNIHVFGELAVTNKMDKAWVNGVLVSVDSRVDMALVYRNISSKYQSLYTNAFTESTFPTNEEGMYAGISIRPNNFWRVDVYADFYRFPWLRYLVESPSPGADYFAQLTYKPNRQLEIYARYRTESKARNFNPFGAVMGPVEQRPRQNFRWQMSYRVSSPITFRNRIEMTLFDRKGAGKQTGFLAYADCIYKPLMKKYSGSVRLQYFETDGYDSRMYAFENDVLYSFSIPVFYDKGYRYYANFNYDVSKKLSIWLRWAQTVFSNRTSVGTGLDQIEGNRRTEVKVQALYVF